MTYTRIAGSDAVTRDADGAFIPASSLNTDWQAYQAWLAAGNTPTAAAVPAPEISPVSMWQGRAVMSQAPYDPSRALPQYQALLAGKTNILDATNTLLAASGNVPLQSFWEYATYLDINDSFLVQLAADLGLTQNDLASLFSAAHALVI